MNMFFLTYVGLCSTLRAVFPRVSKALAGIFTLLYLFLDVLFGALDISQHLHELSLRLPEGERGGNRVVRVQGSQAGETTLWEL